MIFEGFLSVLNRPLSAVPGVTPAIQKILNRFGLMCFWDVVSHKPNGYQNRRHIDHLTVDGPVGFVTFLAHPLGFPPKPPPGRPRRFSLKMGGGEVDLVYFRPPSPFVLKHLQINAPIAVSGTLEFFKGRFQITHPDHVGPASSQDKWVGHETLYPLTAGLSHRRAAYLAQYALDKLPVPPEWLPLNILETKGFRPWKSCLHTLHHPTSTDDVSPNAAHIKRLAFDELLAHQLSLRLTRRHNQTGTGKSIGPPGALSHGVRSGLPFSLTADQQTVLTAIESDLTANARMVRLLQGDVGSGKTVVALLSMIQAVDNGYQAALLAPTEILARQHGETFVKLAPQLADRCVVLTARDTGAKKRSILNKIASGDVSLIIGTHALIQNDVVFHRLGYGVIDEQHRFGIEQRIAFMNKGQNVDMLSMTATPIPRTLMLAFYGDLPCSYLKTKPHGRGDVTTRVLPLSRIDEVLEALKRPLSRDERIYWVCPLIDESELLDVKAAEDRYTALCALFGPDRIGLVHGRLKTAEKDAVMKRFIDGEHRILVSTTVIEVGVDVPNATVMVIEHAERFGLAQLHQLRGRIGRSSLDSACVLLYQGPLHDTASERLKMMRATTDGFRLAEEDLRLRGGGDVLGLRQSGMPSFKFADLEHHQDLLDEASKLADQILTADPNLLDPSSAPIRWLLALFEGPRGLDLLQSG